MLWHPCEALYLDIMTSAGLAPNDSPYLTGYLINMVCQRPFLKANDMSCFKRLSTKILYARPGKYHYHFAVLDVPSFAKETIDGQPTKQQRMRRPEKFYWRVKIRYIKNILQSLLGWAKKLNSPENTSTSNCTAKKVHHRNQRLGQGRPTDCNLTCPP